MFGYLSASNFLRYSMNGLNKNAMKCLLNVSNLYKMHVYKKGQ